MSNEVESAWFSDISARLSELWPVFDGLSVLICLKDRGLRVVGANRAVCDMLGVARDELLGKPTWPLLGEAGAQAAMIDHEVLSSSQSKLGVVEQYPGTERPRWFLSDRVPVRDADGSVVGLICTSTDVTNQMRARHQLAMRDRLLDTATDGIMVHDLEGNILYANKSAALRRGYSVDEFSHLKLSDIDAPDQLAYLEEKLRTLRETGHLTFIGRDRHKDGSEFPVEVSAVLETVEDETLVLSVVRDISERTNSQQALRDSERKYRELFEQSVDAVNLVTVDGWIVDANPAWYRLLGYDPQDLEWLNASDVYVEKDGRARFLQRIAESGELTDETRFRRKDGTEFDCHRSVRARYSDDGTLIGFQTVFHDITERKQAERELQESEHRFRLLADNLHDAVVRLGPDLRLLYANRALDQFSGHEHSAHVGDKLTEMSRVPDMIQDIRESTQSVFESGRP
ncbi:MAG: PAS domain S-box protein, partial [Chloroflexota bacterium]